MNNANSAEINDLIGEFGVGMYSSSFFFDCLLFICAVNWLSNLHEVGITEEEFIEMSPALVQQALIGCVSDSEHSDSDGVLSAAEGSTI